MGRQGTSAAVGMASHREGPQWGIRPGGRRELLVRDGTTLVPRDFSDRPIATTVTPLEEGFQEVSQFAAVCAVLMNWGNK